MIRISTKDEAMVAGMGYSFDEVITAKNYIESIEKNDCEISACNYCMFAVRDWLGNVVECCGDCDDEGVAASIISEVIEREISKEIYCR